MQHGIKSLAICRGGGFGQEMMKASVNPGTSVYYMARITIVSSDVLLFELFKC